MEKNNDEEQTALMIEKLLLIVSIDEQIIRCNENIYHRRVSSTWLERNQMQKRELAGIRGAIKQSLQADLNSFLGKRNLKAFVEIKKAYDRELPSGMDLKTRLQKAIKILIPTFGKYMDDAEE